MNYRFEASAEEDFFSARISIQQYREWSAGEDRTIVVSSWWLLVEATGVTRREALRSDGMTKPTPIG